MKKILIVCTTDSMIYNFLMDHIEYLNNNDYIVDCVCSKTGFYFNYIKEHCNVNIYEVPFTRSPISIKNFTSLLKTNSIMKKNKYDIVFCHEPVGGLIGRIVGKINKTKVIYIAHGFHFFKGSPKKNIIFYIAEKFLSLFTDVLVTINEEDFNASKKFFAKKTKKINGIGIDIKKFKVNKNDYLRKKYHLKNKDIIVLSVGELIERKNHISFIKAIEKLDNHNIHYFIAGDGELKDYLNNYIVEKNLKNIHLLGYCDNVNELCNSSDIFVMPSLQEGLSVALMEAMACGKNIIASNIRGNIDLIDNLKGGILVKPKDIDGYCEAMKTIINNNLDFGKYNIKKITKFDISIIKKEILKIISEE